MKIVIEMPEDKYKRIVEKYDTFPVEMKEWGLDAIKNGIPLPKEHGRLIDVNEIVYETECIYTPDGCCTTSRMSNIYATPTIIEAESEE